MPEVCRVYNYHVENLGITIEPWGTDYLINRGKYISIHAEDYQDIMIEMEWISECKLVVYLNNCIFDDINTSIIKART